MDISSSAQSLSSGLPLVIVVLGFAVLVLVAVVFFSTLLLKRILISWQGMLHDTRDVHKSAETVLNRAREEAIEITGQAQAKIKEFEGALERLGDAAGQQFKRVLEGAAQNEGKLLSGDAEEFHVLHRRMIEENKTEYQAAVQAMVRDIGKVAEGASAEALSLIQKQILAHQSQMESELRELQRQGREAAEARKKETIQKVEDSLYSFLAFISARVLGGALNLESHQALVMRVLEDAKREGFFDQ